MPEEMRLGIDERFKVLRKCQQQYRKASRPEKTVLLDQWGDIVKSCGLARSGGDPFG